MSVFETLWELFNRGGLMMWPILVGSVLALTVAVERLWFLRRSRVLPLRTVQEVLRLVREGRIDEARAVCRADDSPFAIIALAGLDWWDHGFEAVREAIADAGRREAPRLVRGLGLVGTVASVSPLMGLLGTVLGMIEVFRSISLTGPGGGEELSSGIAVALLTTAFGLSVGIPSLVLYNVLSSRAERLVAAMEAACHEIVRSAQPSAETAGAPPARAAESASEGLAAAGGGEL